MSLKLQFDETKCGVKTSKNKSKETLICFGCFVDHTIRSIAVFVEFGRRKIATMCVNLKNKPKRPQHKKMIAVAYLTCAMMIHRIHCLSTGSIPLAPTATVTQTSDRQIEWRSLDNALGECDSGFA